MCPGLSHGMAIHFGRIAGLNAASEKTEIESGAGH
jgi:hypothetical protein